MDKEDYALLKVIASTMEDIKNEVKEIKQDIRETKETLLSKVDKADFGILHKRVSSLEKSRWFNAGFSAAIGAGISFLAAHIFK